MFKMDMDKKYCVYLHSDGDKIFYVGYGNHSRPFSYLCRNRLWYEYVENKKYLHINIVDFFKNKKEAQDLENFLIKKYSPYANSLTKSYKNKKYFKKNKFFNKSKKDIVSLEDFELWIIENRLSSSEAANICNVSKSAISKWRDRGRIPNVSARLINKIIWEK